MLTKQDLAEIRKIIKVELTVNNELFYTKEEIDKKFSDLLTAVDNIAKDNLKKFQEAMAFNDRIRKVENWAEKAAPKVGIKFQH